MRKARALLAVALVSLTLVLLAAACGGGEDNPFGVNSELVTVAERPMALAFAPDGRLFYVEQFTGNVRVVSADGELQAEPFAHVDVAVWLSWGVTGLALDPDFDTNHYVYVYFTTAGSPTANPNRPIGTPRVVRFTDEDNTGVNSKVIVDDFPETNPERPGVNANGNMHFGPDGLLYVTVGDFDYGPTDGPGGEPFALDLTTPVGKMLRVSKDDGEAPEDNPFVDDPDADPRVFARGFLVGFDFAFHPETGQIYGADHTASCEELNIVEAGGNYGWPDVGEFPFSDCVAGDQIRAIHFLSIEEKEPGEFLSFVAVSGLEFVSGEVYPIIGDSLLVCEFETQLMRRLVLTGSNFDQVAEEDVDVGDVVVEDCQMDITISPDGIVYYSNETEIRRLDPIADLTPEGTLEETSGETPETEETPEETP